LPFSTARSVPVSFYEPFRILSEFSIETDADRNPIAWPSISSTTARTSPSDALVSGAGFLGIDYGGIVDSKSVTFGGTPGNLTIAPIPLPPAGLLLLAAIAGAASLRRRRPSA
jgi:hypothetical protein